MSDEQRPEILDTETEQSILIGRLGDDIERAWRLQLQPGAEPFARSTVAVTAVLRSLRVLSARQLAVLLAAEANRGVHVTIREPPRYPAEEIAGVR